MRDTLTDYDPRTTDAVARYSLPYPISALYRLVYSTHRSGMRLGFMLRLVEGVLRFLALVNLADASGRGIGDKRIRKWLSALERPGMGKLAYLVDSTTRHIEADGAPFLTEMLDRRQGAWSDAVRTAVELRNRLVHDEFQVPDAEAGFLLEELSAPLRTILGGVTFLREYHLGIAQGLRTTSAGFRFFWYGSRGLEETTRPVRLAARQPVADNVVVLLHPTRDVGLCLAPFFHWGVTEGDRATHLMWLHDLHPEAPGGAARYSHPVLRQGITRDLVRPDDPEGQGVSVDVWLRDRESTPNCVHLGLDGASRAALAGAPTTRTFESRYRIVGKVGEGGMGTVWAADDLVLGRRCALKVLNKDLTQSPTALKRLLREGQLLARIDHPGVVDVYDVAVAGDDTPYVVMPLLDGEDLESHIRRAGPLSLADGGTMVCALLDALEAVHEAGVVHRDLKPSNVMLTDDGPRLLDLGIASVADGEKLTQTLERMGTPLYMAPEQWSGEATVRSDLFSMGRILFTTLVGRPPRMSGDSLAGSIDGLPTGIEAVFARATAHEPDLRYATAAEMAAALRDALLGGPAGAAVTTGARVRERVTRPGGATPFQYISKSRDDFYAYYGRQLAAARKAIWFTSDGFNLHDPDSRRFAAFIGEKHAEALAAGAEVHRFQVIRSMHLNWVAELERVKARWGEQYFVHVNERLDEIENFCVIDPDTPHVVVETMHPEILAEGQYSVADFATFVHGNADLALRVMERMRRVVEHKGTRCLDLDGLAELRDDLFDERLSRLRRWVRRNPRWKAETLAEQSGIFDREVINAFVGR